MTDVKKFAENQNFLEINEVKKGSEEALNNFIQKHGVEFARGYLAAIEHFQPKVKAIWLAKASDKNYYTPTQAKMRDAAKELTTHMLQIIELKEMLDHSNSIANMRSLEP